MQLSNTRPWVAAIAAALTLAQLGTAADHGPVFGLATPTSPQGGWSFDLGVNGRSGTTSALEAELSYGLTPNIKLAVSGPVVFQPDPYPRSSVTANTPISGDFSGLHGGGFSGKTSPVSVSKVPPLPVFSFPARSRKPAFIAA